MFTGIVEAVGRVVHVEESAGGRLLEISAAFAHEVAAGQSVAVDGACLTAEAPGSDSFSVVTIGTTLSRTIAAGYEAGAAVNLERGARIGDRLDGHMVQGHVDGVGELLAREGSGNARLLDFQIPESVYDVTIRHGSITINGVSLTVNDLRPDLVCQVGIIPFTWEHTNLSRLEPGARVNVEGDLIGKYLGRIAESWRAREPGGADVHAP